MKTFKFFRGYTDDLATRFLETDYRFLGTQNIYMGGFDVANDIDPYAVGTRQINATWTREMAEDVSRFQNIDAEAELTALLTETIAQNIDRNILRGFRQLGVSSRSFEPFELRRINTDVIISQSGVTFNNPIYTPIIQGII